MKTNAIDWLQGKIQGPLQACEIYTHRRLWFVGECPQCEMEWERRRKAIEKLVVEMMPINLELAIWLKAKNIELSNDAASWRDKPSY